MSMEGRTVLITGATGFLGSYMAETIAELGGDLILVDIETANYIALLETLKQYNSKVLCMDCDLESEEQRSILVDRIEKENLSVNALINNAAFVGTSDLKGWVTSFDKQSVDTWRRVFEVNLTSAFDLIKKLTPKLMEGGYGSIINVASIYGHLGPDYSLYDDTTMGNPAAYAASKGGLIQLTRWLSTTVSPHVRANAISLGGVFRNQPDKFVERYEKRTPLGRMAVEEDFKGIIAYLASDMSKYVTGQNIHVDGGWSAW